MPLPIAHAFMFGLKHAVVTKSGHKDGYVFASVS